MPTHTDVLTFWFEDHSAADWFSSSDAFDKELRDRFLNLHRQVALGEKFAWRRTPRGRLAEILVLDQFSRQLFRGEARAFATDGMALALAQEMVAGGHDKALNGQQRLFAYMPYMHSESPVIHEEAVDLFKELDSPDNLEFEMKHKTIIDRFGRYPMRNAALGRTSTPEEIAYIAERGGSFF